MAEMWKTEIALFCWHQEAYCHRILEERTEEYQGDMDLITEVKKILFKQTMFNYHRIG